MSFFDTYKTYLNAQGGSIKGSSINSMKQNILNGFFDSPSYQSVYINNSTTPSDTWITDDSKTIERKLLTTKPDADILSVGDLIKWKNDYWLTMIVDDMVAYFRGSIEKCNSTLAIQSAATQTQVGMDAMGRPVYSSTPGASNNYPCIAKSQVRMSQLLDDTIKLPEGRLEISLQYTDNPMITENTEFTMYNRKYKIIHCDYTNVINDKGIIKLTVERV